MSIKTMPFENLIHKIDKINEFKENCCYGNCQNKSILSHTIAKNYLNYLNPDSTKILTFEPSIFSSLNKITPQLIKQVNKNKFSTFYGFCKEHDNMLFRSIDLFDGSINKKIAVLVHYRNICYGINLIKIQIKRLHCVSKQNYINDNPENMEAKNAHKLLKDGSLIKKLEYCLSAHLSRKKQLETMIESGKFDDIKFVVLCGNIADNPLFCGRLTYLLHQNHPIFKSPGYSFKPWITYMTLIANQSNYLIFCWLKRDQEHANDLECFYKDKQEEFKNILAVLAYACSDALAVEKQLYSKYSHLIIEMIKDYRLY